MDIKSEHFFAGAFVGLVVATLIVVFIAGAWFVLRPTINLPDLTSFVNPTTTSTTSTSTTSTTTSSTSTTSTSSTSTSTTTTSTTQAPFYVCQDSLTENEIVQTRCQNKIPGHYTTGSNTWYDCNVPATVVYSLANVAGDYDELSSKISGSVCNYVQQEIKELRCNYQLMSCEMPRNLTRTGNGTFVKP